MLDLVLCFICIIFDMVSLYLLSIWLITNHCYSLPWYIHHRTSDKENFFPTESILIGLYWQLKLHIRNTTKYRSISIQLLWPTEQFYEIFHLKTNLSQKFDSPLGSNLLHGSFIKTFLDGYNRLLKIQRTWSKI